MISKWISFSMFRIIWNPAGSLALTQVASLKPSTYFSISAEQNKLLGQFSGSHENKIRLQQAQSRYHGINSCPDQSDYKNDTCPLRFLFHAFV